MADIPAVVFHGSPDHGITELTPRPSTHGRPWVYATPLIAVAAVQLQPGGDLSCSHGLRNDQVYMYERWPGAMCARYAGKGGALYELPAHTFRAGCTSFSAELVSEVPVRVLREHYIGDALAYLNELGQQGLLDIYLHDRRPAWIPEDDGDLIDRIVRWSRGYPASRPVEYARNHLPHLVPAVLERLGHEANS